MNYFSNRATFGVEPTDTRAHLSGTNTTQPGYVWDAYVLPLPAQTYTVKAGDVLGFRMYQNNAGPGLSFGFTDGSNSDWYCPYDQYGCVIYSSLPQGQWVNRIMTLGTSAMAGKSLAYLFLENHGPAGQYDVMVADITITSPDGTVTTLLGRGATGSSTGNLGLCNAVGSWPTFPVTCNTEQVLNPGFTADKQTLIFTLGDHLGSASQEFTYGGWMTASTQFMPFGGEINPQGTTDNHYKFTGKERDAESGLDYFGARYYSSNMGRWMSPDWSAQAEPVPYAKLSDPQSLNLYGYMGNNPLGGVDADGHCCQWLSNFGTGLANSTYRPLGQMIAHPLNTLSGIGTALAHPIATAEGAWGGIKSTSVSVMEGDGTAIGTAVGSAAMFFVPGGEEAEAAGSLGKLNLLGKAGEAAEAGEAVGMAPKLGEIGGPGAGKVFADSTKDAAAGENAAAFGGQTTCVYCQEPVGPGTGNTMNIDHAQARANGGNNSLNNAQVTCEYCNKSKGTGTEPKNPKNPE